jgi:hypothetical protein
MSWIKIQNAEFLLVALDFRLEDKPVALIYPDELRGLKEGFDALKAQVRTLEKALDLAR